MVKSHPIFYWKKKVKMFRSSLKLFKFRVSKNYLVLLLLGYYFIAATMYIPVYIDIHFFIKNRLWERRGSSLPKKKKLPKKKLK